jgi:hypothetical protein
MATRRNDGYEVGKKGESEVWHYLHEAGYVRPTRTQRANIAQAFADSGKVIHKSGFDVVDVRQVKWLDSPDLLMSKIEKIVLFEVKAAGKNRRASISDGFKGFGFTLTENERKNAEALGDQYKFVFVNLQNRSHHKCSIDDFFSTEKARIYSTWSVFLTEDVSSKRRRK